MSLFLIYFSYAKRFHDNRVCNMPDPRTQMQVRVTLAKSALLPRDCRGTDSLTRK
jgi:hypothetical protein